MDQTGVLFDFDGTLTRPGALDFLAVKKAMGCPPDEPILEYIDRLDAPDERQRAYRILDKFEMNAAAVSRPNKGAEKLICRLKSKSIPVGLITRNSRNAVIRALKNFRRVTRKDFTVIICREDAPAPKPDPEGVLVAAEKMGVFPENLWVVGDFRFDIEAGNRAGAKTILLGTPDPAFSSDFSIPDITVSALDEIIPFLEDRKSDRYRKSGRFPEKMPKKILDRLLSAGKFPNDLLKDFLEDFQIDDPAVLIHPGIGEDTAAVSVENEEILILKSDPITFATDAIGHYAVLINANDIATSGADPRWFLATILLPVGISVRRAFAVLNELHDACRKWGITLCGGHTEITDAVTRPVISGTLAGTVKKTRLLDKKNIRPGDTVLLTKGVAVEGTSIIAREFADTLREKGVSETDIGIGRSFLKKIGVLTEARVAREIPGVIAMHDVTEGGLATAISELAAAGGHDIEVSLDAVFVYPETAEFCRLLNIDPLGLIGSGSLLICCRETACGALMKQLSEEDIPVARIGTVRPPGKTVTAVENGKPVPWPKFEVDEITRLF